MSQSNTLMNENISMLGSLLGDTIREALGEATFERVETKDDSLRLLIMETLPLMKN